MRKTFPMRLASVTTLAMVAFAANSALCREALASGHVGAPTFTLVRLASGAVVPGLILLCKYRSCNIGRDWLSAAALFGYASGFSYAYTSLSAGTGGLLMDCGSGNVSMSFKSQV